MSTVDDELVTAATAWVRAVLTPAPAPVPARRRRPVAPESRGGVRQARAALLEAMGSRPRSRFGALSKDLGLRPFEQDVALLCLAHALSTEVQHLLERHEEGTDGAPTFALALSLAEDGDYDAGVPGGGSSPTRVAAVPDWGALAPHRPLRRWRLIEISQPGGRPLISGALRMDERVVNHLRGLDYLDDRLAPLMDAPLTAHGPLAESQETRLAALLEDVRRAAPQDERLVVQLPGGDRETKRLFAANVAAALGCRLHSLAADQLVTAGADLGTFADLWNRETYFQPIALLLSATEPTPALDRLVARLRGVVLLDVRDPVPAGGLLLDVSRPTPAEQRHLWRTGLGDDGSWAGQLAAQFTLNPAEIVEISSTVTGDDAGARAWDVCRVRARPRLEGLAQRVRTRTVLDDVQLPAHEKRLLEQVRDQTRHRVRVYDEYGFRTRLTRGLGITALLAGESGTGKTMAAEALANELRLDLYRIDLASVVSKYIGETEKNLRQLFDAAEQSSAVLLFDEADAIFGKRSEVQDSHDRYANIEISYLLQRMEVYEGLAILTTNMKSALDPAFLRRLRFLITFPFPAEPQRQRIWRTVFPSAGPSRESTDSLVPGVTSLDMGLLARPNLTGGQIRNIALHATFLAAARDEDVSMPLLAEAAREELHKSNRPFVATEFAGWEHDPASAPAPAVPR